VRFWSVWYRGGDVFGLSLGVLGEVMGLECAVGPWMVEHLCRSR
jgi:hypothetical protein